mmetsp:Transcript_12889/g.32158  ORF Transcript_12889/g.32158 Transcript_12889/m.32158 type:complete len:95 (-) Transcript_12889:284-568(-)
MGGSEDSAGDSRGMRPSAWPSRREDKMGEVALQRRSMNGVGLPRKAPHRSAFTEASANSSVPLPLELRSCAPDACGRSHFRMTTKRNRRIRGAE